MEDGLTPPVACEMSKRTDWKPPKRYFVGTTKMLLHFIGGKRILSLSVVKCDLSRSSFVKISARFSFPGMCSM